MMRNMSDADATLEQLVSDNDALRRQLAQAQERMAYEREVAVVAARIRNAERLSDLQELDTARRAAAAWKRAAKFWHKDAMNTPISTRITKQYRRMGRL